MVKKKKNNNCDLDSAGCYLAHTIFQYDLELKNKFHAQEKHATCTQ